MNRCFLVYTPYQLLCVLNIIYDDIANKNTIILVHKNLEQFEPILKKCKTTSYIFERSLYDSYNKKTPIIERFDVLRRLFNLTDIISKLDYAKEVYDELAVPSDEILCRVFYKTLKKRNRNIILGLYEDGLGTYSAVTFNKKSFLGSTVYCCAGLASFVPSISFIYAFRPDFVKPVGQFLKKRNIYNSPGLSRDFALFVKDKIYDYQNKKVIFLDQGMGDNAIVKHCLKLLLKYYQPEDVIVKMHPRIKSDGYKDFVCSYDGLPFESIVAACNMNDCLIISHSSSGCVNPRLMYNQTPKLVMLQEMEGESMFTVNVRFYNLMNEFYKEDYVKLPKTMTELEQIIAESNVKCGLRILDE